MTTGSKLHEEMDPASAPTLQEAIDRAGSPVKYLWKPDVTSWQPPVLDDEYVGWREEQAAANETVALSDQSHHMFDLFIEGPDATRLLADLSPNDYENFAVGQAKQFIATTAQGQLIGDEILLREAPDKYTMTGTPAAIDWVAFHQQQGDYDVVMNLDPSSEFRHGADPVQFRYQIQGSQALELARRVFGGPLPETKFFHSTPVNLDGREFRALRHGMTGHPGYEFVGEWKDGTYVKQRLLEEGAALGIVRVGAKAYATNAVASGWLPMPTPAVYTDPNLQPYREWLSSLSYEGQYPLHGSFYSENIEDYYSSPYELGYGRLMKFNHDFVGRDALQQSRDSAPRQKVTLVLDPADVRRVFGEIDYFCNFGQYRLESGHNLVGLTFYGANLNEYGTILYLALVDNQHATPGTELTFVWGEHPGPGTDPDADLGFERIKATVAPVPYDQFARTRYRKD
jgi:vanillate/3-O-methylgallate O-demethylase